MQVGRGREGGAELNRPQGVETDLSGGKNICIDVRQTLKVPKCENFHRTYFIYFYTIKPLWVGDFRVKIKNSKF